MKPHAYDPEQDGLFPVLCAQPGLGSIRQASRDLGSRGHDLEMGKENKDHGDDEDGEHQCDNSEPPPRSRLGDTFCVANPLPPLALQQRPGTLGVLFSHLDDTPHWYALSARVLRLTSTEASFDAVRLKEVFCNPTPL
jgi:hypothetical protein